MDENFPTSYEILKKDIYGKMKTKLLLFQIKVEYNIISDFLMNSNIIKLFIKKEMNNTLFHTSFLEKKSNKKDNYNEMDYNEFILFNENKNEKNDFFKVKIIYNNNNLNHSILIMRFIKDEDVNINSKNISDSIQFLDIVISFYVDISDNSTILINELYSNLSDVLFIKFNKIIYLFYEKLKTFTKEKMNKFYCFESILIPDSISNILKYLYSCKIFYDKKFQIQKLKKIKEGMEITCKVGILYPIICETKIFLMNISNNSCFIEIVNLVSTTDFPTQRKLLTTKSVITLFLKKLRSRINQEKASTSENINK